MRIFYYIKPYLLAMLFAIGSLCGLHDAHAKTQSAPTIETFTHNIQLQLTDSLGFPVDGAQFWVTLDIIKEGPKVTIFFPLINFETLATITNPLNLQPLVFGGYLYTSNGFLPENIRPNDLVNRAIVAASNNGASEAFSLTQDPSTLPTPPVGYILQVTNSGALVVQCAGTFGNIIPPGPQIIMPSSITYLVKPKINICDNSIIGSGFTDTTQFTNGAAGDGFRDLHINDAFNGTVVWAWTDNSTVADKTNGTMNLMVAVGTAEKNGNLIIGTPVQLTNFPANVMAWDTSVAINRNDPNNIVVSYGILDNNNFLFPAARVVSFDGGKTWPAPYEYISFEGTISGNVLTVTSMFTGTLTPGLDLTIGFGSTSLVPGTSIVAFGTGTGGVGTYILNNSQIIGDSFFVASPHLNGAIDIIPAFAGGFGDNPGVKSDKFGNIWYLTTAFFDTLGNGVDPSSFYVSTDNGVTYQFVFDLPPLLDPANQFYDYPQYCFGGDGLGNYGLYFQTSIVDLANDHDVLPNIGFIPITGLGAFGIPSFISLFQFVNSAVQSDLTASADGRVWLHGITFAVRNSSYISPSTLLFKSPGALDQNYAGAWDFAIFKAANYYSAIYGLPSGQIAQPVAGFFPFAAQSIIYDETRKALYAMVQFPTPDYSQNMRIVFSISRDNGQTWSNPIDVATTKFANRGFQSMALDTVTGNLVFGWYDGRNDPTFTSVQYFGAIVSAATLDCLVNQIPLSNPLYNIPAFTGCIGGIVGSGCTGSTGVLGVTMQETDALHQMQSGEPSVSASCNGVAGPDMRKMGKLGKRLHKGPRSK
jgi:hypothetical protein